MSVRKRVLGNGQTRWQVDYRDGAGVRRHRQFTTKREADAFHAKARTEVAAGVHTPTVLQSRSESPPICGLLAVNATLSSSRRFLPTGSTSICISSPISAP